MSVTMQDIQMWWELSSQLAVIKEREMTLRKRIVTAGGLNQKEGTNYAPLTHGWKFRSVCQITRDIDKQALEQLEDAMLERGIDPSSLITYEPKLVLSAYGALTDEQRIFFDQVLRIKEAAPQLTIVEDK